MQMPHCHNWFIFPSQNGNVKMVCIKEHPKEGTGSLKAMAFYNYKHLSDPQVLSAIEHCGDLRHEIQMINSAYEALMNYRKTEADPVFNTYFEIMPCGRLDDQYGGYMGLSYTIEHGIIITCPHVPDAELPPEALVSRACAMASALRCVKRS